MFSLFSQEARQFQSSKIIPEKRFKNAPQQIMHNEYIFGAISSNITLLQKASVEKPVKKTAKSHIWLSKKPQHLEQYTKEEQSTYSTIQAPCEVFSAWQYEAFIGVSKTQPKYYLVQHDDNSVSVTSKHITNYKSIRQFEDKAKQLPIIFVGDNLKLFAQMLVTYIWLAGSDFKCDHIGIDKNNTLICLDFGASLVPFLASTQTLTKAWNFSITSEDLSNAPFFETYRASNFFVKSLGKELAFLKNNEKFKAHFFTAILKKCIFPDYITFAALELFDNAALQTEVKKFIQERTVSLRMAAINNTEFAQFILKNGDGAFKKILEDILNGNLSKTRYFRRTVAKFETAVTEQLNFNYRDLYAVISLNALREKSNSASEMLIFLRRFCSAQYNTQKIIDEALYFNKGSKDKCIFYSNILATIDETLFSTMDVNTLESTILDLTLEVAIIAYHKRYKNYNRFAGITKSAGWKEFNTILQVLSADNRYVPNVRNILTANKEIYTYNKYRKSKCTHASSASIVSSEIERGSEGSGKARPEAKKVNTMFFTHKNNNYDTVVNINKVTLYLKTNGCTDKNSLLGQKQIVMSAIQDFMQDKITWFHVCEIMECNPSWNEGFFSQVKKTIDGIRQGNMQIQCEENLYKEYADIKKHMDILQLSLGTQLKPFQQNKANKILDTTLYNQLKYKNPEPLDKGQLSKDLRSIKSTTVGPLLELLYANMSKYHETVNKDLGLNGLSPY